MKEFNHEGTKVHEGKGWVVMKIAIVKFETVEEEAVEVVGDWGIHGDAEAGYGVTHIPTGLQSLRDRVSLYWAKQWAGVLDKNAARFPVEGFVFGFHPSPAWREVARGLRREWDAGAGLN